MTFDFISFCILFRTSSSSELEVSECSATLVLNLLDERRELTAIRLRDVSTVPSSEAHLLPDPQVTFSSIAHPFPLRFYSHAFSTSLLYFPLVFRNFSSLSYLLSLSCILSFSFFSCYLISCSFTS